MRSTTPSSRRPRSRLTHRQKLATIAEVVDLASLDEPDHVLIHLQEPRSELVLGLKACPVEVHPFQELAGFTAPADWWAFGLRAHGRAHHLDESGRVTEGIATTFLLDREGRETSLLRTGDAVKPLRGRAEGTIADLCRRVLGLPTSPGPVGSQLLWTTQWLDAVLTEWGRPERRRAVASGFGALTALHPATGGEEVSDLGSFAAIAGAHADQWTWDALRHADAPIELPDGALPRDVTEWMDDGFFARWTIGAYPPARTLALDLRDLLGEPLGTTLLHAVVTLLEQAPPPP